MCFKRSATVWLGRILAATATLTAPLAAVAHPVFAPYDNTAFAPITRSGALISLEPIVKGLVSPVKGVAAPGDPNNLYVVDQPGKIWRINVGPGATLPVDVSTPAGQVPFLDVSASVVPLGILGPNTYDERGLMGLAFHPRYAQNGLF
jgi:hypothetical protein